MPEVGVGGTADPALFMSSIPGDTSHVLDTYCVL